MNLTTTAFADGGIIPAEFAFCSIDAATHVKLSTNRNPDFAWSGLPPGTKSLVLLCHDPDVPSRGDDVNQEGRVIRSSLARVEFFHWALLDLPADTPPIARGEFSDGVTARGKPGPHAPRGARQGINDYTAWFKDDQAMSGNYFGYDGPCPPWNDELPHHYVFTLIAVAVPRLDVAGVLSGQEVRKAAAGHALGTASVTGRYTLNPGIRL